MYRERVCVSIFHQTFFLVRRGVPRPSVHFFTPNYKNQRTFKYMTNIRRVQSTHIQIIDVSRESSVMYSL